MTCNVQLLKSAVGSKYGKSNVASVDNCNAIAGPVFL
jgi:hypothetical protein